MLGAVKLLATSVRCQARIVSGLTRVATSSSACLPTSCPSRPGLPLAVGQADTARELLAQDTVFCDQVCIAKQEFLVHEPVI